MKKNMYHHLTFLMKMNVYQWQIEYYISNKYYKAMFRYISRVFGTSNDKQIFNGTAVVLKGNAQPKNARP